MKKLLSWLLVLALCLSLSQAVALAEPIVAIHESPDDETAEEPVGEAISLPQTADEGDGRLVAAPTAEPDALPPETDEPQDVVASGDCGDNLIWTLDSDGLLTISGTGEMWDLTDTGYPWDPYSEQIRSLALGADLTLIGNGAFSRCGNIQTISFAGAAPSFGDDCFSGLTACASYPIGTGTWIPDIRSGYGGTITWVPIMTESGDFPCGDDLTWHIEGTVLSISGTGEMWNYNGWDHFAPWYEMDALNAVETLAIGEGVTGIGEYAFAEGRCMNRIGTVSFPSSLLRIEKGAFWQSGMKQITFPDGLESIGEEAFMLGSLQGELIIPASVKTIGIKAFWYDYLDSVTLSGTIEEIGYLAFGQNNITDITFGDTKERWNEIGKSSGYDVYQTTIHCTDGDILPAAKELCGEGLSWEFSDGILTISGNGEMFDFDSHEENGHTVYATPWREITDQITGVMINSGVTSIGNNAFCGCTNLVWCQIPNGVTRIGVCAFTGCQNLQSITLPESVVTIENGAFVGTGLRTVTIPAGMSALGEGAFSGCFYLETVIFQPTGDSGNAGTNAVRSRTSRSADGLAIGASAFSGCDNLTEVSLSDHIVGIGEQAFYDCGSLRTITIPAKVTDVDAGALGACDALEEIVVDEQNTAFRSVDGVLYDIDGESLVAYPGGKQGPLVLPENVKTICSMAFVGASGLTSVTIPASTTDIGSDAFRDCTALTEIRFEGSAPRFGDNTFDNVTATVYYPENDPSWTEEVLQDYGGSPTWVVYESAPAVVASGDCGDALTWTLDENGTLTITGTGEMWNWGWMVINTPWAEHLSSIKNVVIEPGATSIGENAFVSCTNLASVTIPGSVTHIGYAAFSGCGGLTSVTIPEGVTSIGFDAFTQTGLTSVTIPASVTEIGNAAFNCPNLESIQVDGANTAYASVDGILYSKDMSTLNCCPAGKSGDVVIPDGVTVIAVYAFRSCSRLTGVTLPEGLTSIASMAFDGCSSLTSVTIPASVTDIGTSAFNGCSSLESIQVDGANAVYSSVDGILYSKDMSTLIQCPVRKSGDVTIRSGVTSIGDYAFSNCSNLTSVTLPDGLTSIGNQAFFQCSSLTSVTFPASVTSIRNYSFSYCSMLTEIHFEGPAPSFEYEEWYSSSSCFSRVTATAYYPAGDDTWTEDVRQNYGGTITWVAYETEPDHTPGDLNGDGKVNTADVTLLAKYIKARGQGVEVNAAALDVNGDGKVNTADVTLLAKYVKARGNGVVIH